MSPSTTVPCSISGAELLEENVEFYVEVVTCSHGTSYFEGPFTFTTWGHDSEDVVIVYGQGGRRLDTFILKLSEDGTHVEEDDYVVLDASRIILAADLEAACNQTDCGCQ